MPMPRPDEASIAFFKSTLPPDPRIQLRPMFGNLAAFVGGHLFAGLYGNDVFIRLPETERARLLAEDGASLLEPMPGRPMKEYVVVPTAWRQQPDRLQDWVICALNWAGELPEKASPKSGGKKGTKSR